MSQAQALNVAEYPKYKAAGKMTLAKIGDATVLLAHQKYNPETGVPTEPITSQLNAGNIAEMRAALAEQQAAIDAASAGLDALEADMKALLG